MNKYPTDKVATGYALLGGLVGGGVFIIIAQMEAAFMSDGLLSSLGNIYYLVFYAMVGTIPASLTGTVLAVTKTCLTSIKDGIKCFIVGFLATLACYFVPMGLVFVGPKGWMALFRCPIFIALLITGGLSSVILAFLLLPKGANNG